MQSRIPAFPWRPGGARFLPLLLAGLVLQPVLGAAVQVLQTRSRVRETADTNRWSSVERAVSWDPARTAVVVCDMWDRHHCPDATERVGEMAPRMNEVLRAARAQGMLILHCPSDTMEFYRDHPGRKLAQAAPPVETAVPLQGWCARVSATEPPLPIDDSDGGCDGCPECPGYRAWSRQHPALEIQEGDAITDSAEAYYLMRQRGITNVIVMGVHINMCVLGRPFAIRQLVAQGQNVVLMRDLTDSMYHHRKPPYVPHFRGTELVVEHIEQYWCPSITSTDFVGGAPFRFREDVPRRIVMVIGENEYRTEETLPEFARSELEGRGLKVSYVMASPKEGDGNFRDLERIRDADLVLVSVRRRAPPRALLDLLREHLDAGKPLVGIRTASHAFAPREAVAEGFSAWTEFDGEVLGATYADHYNNKPPQAPHTLVESIATQRTHPVLTGVPAGPFPVTSHLYRYRNLAPTITPLLQGLVEGRDEREPVAWVNTAGGRRIFYTSMGNPDDFRLPAFRRLLLNGLLWCLQEPLPPADALRLLAPAAATPAPEPGPTPAPATARPPAPPNPPVSSPPAVPDLPQNADTPALAPSEALTRFTVAEDLVWTQLLAEPQIAQPVFLNFDERGRLWVVEYRQYPTPAGLTLVSRDSVWRAVYDRVPPPPPRHIAGADRISIHADADGDGVYESHRVFLDGLNIATAVERGRGGVWVLNPPYLLFYPDANQDDVPDGDPEVRLAGFGLEDTHSVANSLRWGPDGWLYGAQGSTVTANIQVLGPEGRPLNPVPHYSQGQNIWRYHPELRRYEVFSEGGGNAFGCEFDSQGRVFSGHNGGDTRGFHYQQGAYLQKGFEKHGPLSNPYAFGFFPAMPHDSVPRFTHNVVRYDHGALGPSHQGHLFGVEPLQGRLVESELIPDGSSFRTRDIARPVTSQDRWFRPVDLKAGPDGALYVCDWYDQQVNHYRNHEGHMDASNGRVYRLGARGAARRPAEDLSRLESAALVERLSDPNRWVRQTAQRLLADRRDPSLRPALSASLRQAVGQGALETLWALHASGGLGDAETLEALRHSEPQVRLWAIRLAGDDHQVSPELSTRLSALAASESDREVRNQLAATARRLPAPDALPVIRALSLRSEDVADNRQPLLIWWAMESQCEDHREEVLRLYAAPEFWNAPLVAGHLVAHTARRFAQAGTQRDLKTCARLFEQSPDAESSRRLLTGFEAAFQGRPVTGLPPELVAAMDRHGVASPAWALRRGDPKATQRALSVVADETALRAERLEFLGVMSEQRVPGAVPVLSRAYRGVFRDDALRAAILAAFQPYDDPAIAEVVLSAYPALGPSSLPVAQTLLASRPAWSRALVAAIARKPSDPPAPPIPASSIPPGIVRRLKQHRDPDLLALLATVWPDTGPPTSADMERLIRERAAVVRAGTGDPYAGRTLFQNTCGGCHRLFGHGGEVGPELTVYDRADLEGMLLAIVHPSAEIREGYENYSVETRDGRSLSGFLAEQDNRRIVLRGLDNRNIVLSREDIAELQPAGLSLMPEGLLDALDDQQTRDLFAYLRSTQPLVGEPPRSR